MNRTRTGELDGSGQPEPLTLGADGVVKSDENSPGLWPNGVSDPQYFVVCLSILSILSGGEGSGAIGSSEHQ